MPAPRDLEILALPDQTAWRRWLEGHHADTPGVWLKIAKKGSGAATPTYREAVEEAIRHGWIDGQVRAHDDIHYLQRFTPRTRRSRWSQVNRATAQRLIDEGQIHPAGLDQVVAARQDGRWDDAYSPQSQATVPEDFDQALQSHPEAHAFFQTLTGGRRYAFLYRLHHVKSPAARAKRIGRYIDLLNQGKTLQD